MAFVFSKAVRRRVPLLISMAGVSTSGKTYSALLMSAGMCPPKGRVGFIDTENRRGEMYADDPGIRSAFPDGYEYAEMRAPFAPARFSEAIDDAAAAGITTLVIDSGSHEWEGYGGCSEIAETNKKRWAAAKMEHKKFMYRLMAAPMDIIICLRAREKTKITKDAQGRELHVPQGILPICEKNFVFEMTCHMMIEEETHRPVFKKYPKVLASVFSQNIPLITTEIGASLLQWAESGSREGKGAVTLEDLKAQAVHHAANGMTEYQSFWKSITPTQQQMLKPFHAENKKIAETADRSAAEESVFRDFAKQIAAAESDDDLAKIMEEVSEAQAAGDLTMDEREMLDREAQGKMAALPQSA